VRGQLAVPDLLAHCLQAAAASPYLQVCAAHVPERIRPPSGRQARRRAVLQVVSQHTAACQGHTRHEGQQEQLPPSPKGRVQRREDRAPQPPATHQLPGVGWSASHCVFKEAQNASCKLQVAERSGYA